MKLTAKYKKIIIFIITILLFITFISSFIYLILDRKNLKAEIKELSNKQKIVYDTIYDRDIINEIQTQIEEKQNQYDNYKKDLIYETTKIQTINDSASIELFYKLLSEL